MHRRTKILIIILTGVLGYLAGPILSPTRAAEFSLRRLVSGYPEVAVHSVGKALFLQGAVDSYRDIGALQSLAQGIESASQGYTVTLLVRVSEKGKKQIVDQIDRQLMSPELGARFVGDRLVLEGVAENDFEADRAVEYAKTFLTPGYLVSAHRQPSLENGSHSPASALGANSPTLILDLIRVRPRPRGK